MFERILGHFTILFWEFGTKINENDEKEGELRIIINYLCFDPF